MEIKILTVGGTIDKVYFDQSSKYQIGESIADEILKESNVGITYEVESILKKDSLDLTEKDRKKIIDTILEDPHDKIVVTHGTDTMIKTAQLLSQKPHNKVIVLTGSMQPARFKSSDAVFNIGSAVTAVQILPTGVFIAMNGRIFDPNNSRKNVEKKRFEIINE
ncbi:MAG: asparaginase domain-containing protein [Candidatus Marinimicrobia bacterium]|nr:asparaginase domain-containing protein [Candidatus Neomarinimicrobiota bacterium]